MIVADTSRATAIWSAPPGAPGARQLSTIELAVGKRFNLLAIDAGPDATEGASAETYRLWYQIELPAGKRAWVQGAVPSTGETGSDGRPSSIQFPFVPATQVAMAPAASALDR